MKQSTFKAKLNQYFGDVDQYIDKVIESNVEIAVLEKALAGRMEQLGVEGVKDQADIMFDIIGNEEDARKEGKEPSRRVFYKYEDTDEPLTNWDDLAVWLDYTEDDYYFFVALREQIEQAFKITLPLTLEASFVITKHFSENADLITAECLSILHTATKGDCEDYLRRTRDYIKGLGVNAEIEKYLLKYQAQDNKAEIIDVNFFGPLQDPFAMSIQALRQEERKKQKDQDPKDFIDFVFKDVRRIHEETRTVVSQWYGPPLTDNGPGQELYRRQNKLARSKEITALQTLNLARDSKGRRHRSTSSGGLSSVQVFENNDVEIITPQLEDLSLSTNTRQLFDFFLFKGIEQITHKVGDLNKLDKQRSVTVDLDEVATVFSIDKRDARKRLNALYDEMRDLKINITWHGRDDKGKPKLYRASVNIFDADLQEIDLEEKNATARPEDVDEGVQITLYNTGTLLNYNPKRKKEPKNAVKLGRLTMKFSMDFAKHLSQASIVRHNPKGYLINRKKYTSAYSLQCTLENHAYMNRNKRNAGVIGLGTLLKDCYEIPTYEKVSAGNRNYTDRIKKPLLLNIQSLKDVGVLQDFQYYKPDKEAISEADLLTLDYDDFIKCTLHFTLSPIDEEEQTGGSS